MSLSEDQDKRISYIEQKGKSFESQVKKLEKYVNSSDVDPINAKMRLDVVAILYKEYLEYQDELSSIQPNNSFLISFSNVEENYFEIASKISKLQKIDQSLAHSSSMHSNNTTIIERQDLPKLKKATVPTFSGAREEWANFKNKFMHLVHLRPDLSDTVKCTQLFEALKDKALEKVQQFDPSEEDYPKAWQTLLDFYDHKRIVAIDHLNAILDLPKIEKADVDKLSSLIDKARQHLHILDRLGAKPSDELVVRIMERCLPTSTRGDWHDTLELDELPKLDDLIKFIQKAIFKLQSSDIIPSNTNNNNKKRPGEPTGSFQSKKAKLGAKTLVTTSSSSDPKIACLKCNDKHCLYKCPSFLKLKVQERWNFAKSNKLCFNCLRTHPLPCKNEKRCKTCARKHHSLLHNEKKSEISQPKEENSSTSKAPSS